MAELSRKQEAWIQTIEANANGGYYSLGWSDEANDITLDAYQEYVDDLKEDLTDEEIVELRIESWETWRELKRAELSDDDEFSWQSCDSCDSHLGGSRHKATIFAKDGETYPIWVCEDCLLFLANGDVPDDEYL